MNENRKESLLQLAEEFKINKGLETNDHLNLLRSVEGFPKDQFIEVVNFFLQEETDPQILLYLVRLTAKYNSIDSIDALSELLIWKEKFKNSEKKQDEYLKVRCLAAKILGGINDNKAVLPLLYVLNSKGENYKLRLNCAESLGKVGSNYAVAPLIDVVSDEDEKSVYVRESAAKALGQLGDIRALDPLVSILETKKGLIDKFTFLKERVIEAIGKIGINDNKTIRVLKNALIDEAPYIRLGAIEALSELNDEEVLPLIEKMLEDQEEDVARGAVIAIYNVMGEDYIKELYHKENLAGWCKDEIDIILEEIQDSEEEQNNDEQ